MKKRSTLHRQLTLALTCIGLAVPTAWAQQAKPITANPPDQTEGDVIKLSPFTVDASRDRGYFAENTLAGSRMKTNLADLGASISVVTKAQLDDTASVDLNDVFRYEVNTEGSSTYTPQTPTFRNDGLLDVNAGGTQGNSVSSFTNAGANRMRGLGTPGAATNYYPSISAVAPDAYNIQSFEISRGPNSMLFGIGSPAGIVNQTTAQAVLNRDTTRAEVRFDDRGSTRGSISFNRGLLRNKLAIFGALLYDNRQFTRKPSYDVTRRQYGAITYKPFSKTTLRANFEAYSNDNRRPNTVSPTDFITQWNLAGRPVYDNLTKKITQLTTGEVHGPYLSSNSSPRAQEVRDYIAGKAGFNAALMGGAPTGTAVSTANFTTYNGITIFGQSALNPATSLTSPLPSVSALWVPGLAELNQGRSNMQIGDGQLQSWYQPLYTQNFTTSYNNPSGGTQHTLPIDSFSSALSSSTTSALWANPTWADMYNRDQFTSNGWTNMSLINNLGGYKYPGVTDRSIYDWKKVNILQANWGMQRNQNYNVELEQEITKDLFFTAGWFRQDFDQWTNYTIAQLNVTALYVDVNKNQPDGTPNPYYGKPFVRDQDPDRYMSAEQDDHFRAMLAYTPDFTQKKNWLKWLGHHQFLGLWSRDEYMTVAYRQRLFYTGSGNDLGKYIYLPNPNNNATGPTGWSYYKTSATVQRSFYLANPSDPMGKVTRSSGEWNPIGYTGNIRVYNYGNSTFENANVTESFANFDSPTRNQKIIQSMSAGMTNYLWKDRLVTTFGARVDQYKARATTTGAIVLPNGKGTIPALTNQQKFTPDGYLDTSVMWNRFQNASWITGRTKSGGGVFRPFSAWESIESRANSGNQFWQFVRGLGFSYNWSDNFNPPDAAYVDAFGKTLPKPQGVGRDYGVQFSLLDNKLFARITWFKSTNDNQQVSPTATLTRLTSNIDTTLFQNWCRTIALINMGQNPSTDTNFGANLSTDQENAVRAAAQTIWKLPYTYYGDIGTMYATQDSKAQGMEIQLNYNTGNWRNRVTFGRQETINSNVAKQFDAWYAVRNPVWQAARASDYLLPQYQYLASYTAANGSTQVDLTTFWHSYGYNSAVRLTDQFGNTNVENYYGINVTGQVMLARDLNGQAAPNQRKYRWAYNTGYDFRSGKLKGWGVGGAMRWESKSTIGYYGKSSHTNTANPNLIDMSDTTRPIYSKANTYTDLFVKYQRKIWGDHVNMSLQLNVVNAFENGHLQVTSVNYDGSPWGYRIIDPRQFILSAKFDF